MSTTRMQTTPHACAALAALGALLLSGCGGGSDGPSHFEQRLQKQEESADAIRSAGGKAELKNYPPHGSAWAVDLRGANVSDAVLDGLATLERITELNLSKSTINDQQLERINEVGNLIIRLDLSQTAVTDAGLDKLTNLNILMNLDLSGAKVTAAGVDRFRQAREKNPHVGAMFKSPQIRQ